MKIKRFIKWLIKTAIGLFCGLCYFLGLMDILAKYNISDNDFFVLIEILSPFLVAGMVIEGIEKIFYDEK